VPILLAGLVVTAFGGARGFSVVEEGEEAPGGAATALKTNNRDVFSHFSTGMSLEREADFKMGRALFRRLWVSAPSSTKSSDGLGPLYNARGCVNCHLRDGRGHPPSANWPDDSAVSMFLRLSIPPQTAEQKQLIAEHKANVIPEPTYGYQLQNYAIRGHDAEGRMNITYAEEPVTLRDGTVVKLRRPTYTISDLGYGSLDPQVMLSPRVAPQMIGLGLLEAISEEDIRSGAKADTGVSGRPNEVWSVEHNRVMLGRFGWKAGNPTIRQQSAEALAIDIGLSNPLVPRPFGDCTAAQTLCLNAPNGNSPGPDGVEVNRQLLDLMTFYSENLAVPARRDHDDPKVLQGKALFSATGCAACHRPSFTTGVIADQPHLSNQKIWPYTDLLLHDMGEGLADNRPEGVATGREWRTPPLWGIGLTETVSGHTFFLHDGRARSLEEAILWHGGAAQGARDGYAALSKSERDALIAFLRSL
jgi:CxxC motif-containing protein (DUF1111 family)